MATTSAPSGRRSTPSGLARGAAPSRSPPVGCRCGRRRTRSPTRGRRRPATAPRRPGSTRSTARGTSRCGPARVGAPLPTVRRVDGRRLDALRGAGLLDHAPRRRRPPALHERRMPFDLEPPEVPDAQPHRRPPPHVPPAPWVEGPPHRAPRRRRGELPSTCSATASPSGWARTPACPRSSTSPTHLRAGRRQRPGALVVRWSDGSWLEDQDQLVDGRPAPRGVPLLHRRRPPRRRRRDRRPGRGPRHRSAAGRRRVDGARATRAGASRSRCSTTRRSARAGRAARRPDVAVFDRSDPVAETISAYLSPGHRPAPDPGRRGHAVVFREPRAAHRRRLAAGPRRDRGRGDVGPQRLPAGRDRRPGSCCSTATRC